jgi:dihydrofolate reductase
VPRVRYRVAMSLDGYISGPRGEIDWIVQDPAMDFGAVFAQFDTFLMGRRTFELTLQPGSPPFPRGSKVFVVSRTLQPADHPTVTVLTEVSPTSLAKVRAVAGKDVWLFGGGELFRSLLDQRLVDTVEVAIMPVVLGGGVPLAAHSGRSGRLRLTAHKIYDSGIVSLEYAVEALAA